MIKKLQNICILLSLSIIGYAQTYTELSDSLKLNQKNYELNINQFDAAFFKLYFPEGGSFNANQQKEMQFFQTPDMLRFSQTFYGLQSDFHYYHSPSFSFWRNSKPLLFGAAYQAKNLFGQEKLNFFVDVNGQMVNSYEMSEMDYLIPSDQSMGLFWQVGAGLGYEFAPRKTIFIKSSAHFRNMQFIGTKHVGGINVRF